MLGREGFETQSLRRTPLSRAAFGGSGRTSSLYRSPPTAKHSASGLSQSKPGFRKMSSSPAAPPTHASGASASLSQTRGGHWTTSAAFWTNASAKLERTGCTRLPRPALHLILLDGNVPAPLSGRYRARRRTRGSISHAPPVFAASDSPRATFQDRVQTMSGGRERVEGDVRSPRGAEGPCASPRRPPGRSGRRARASPARARGSRGTPRARPRAGARPRRPREPRRSRSRNSRARDARRDRSRACTLVRERGPRVCVLIKARFETLALLRG
mmetsp:Transcript_17356/g.52792  ORF Transcript_17356/g.52792 Transcript_17356/m.52792 type:complete len:272 (+) Transcript_17356:905-1720(+)